MDIILKRLNDKGWFLMFSWQMPDKNLHMVFRRMKEPQLVISVSGTNESRMFGKAEVNVAWMEKFIETRNLEQEYAKFLVEKEEHFKKKTYDYHRD